MSQYVKLTGVGSGQPIYVRSDLISWIAANQEMTVNGKEYVGTKIGMLQEGVVGVKETPEQILESIGYRKESA